MSRPQMWSEPAVAESESKSLRSLFEISLDFWTLTLAPSILRRDVFCLRHVHEVITDGGCSGRHGWDSGKRCTNCKVHNPLEKKYKQKQKAKNSEDFVGTFLKHIWKDGEEGPEESLFWYVFPLHPE